MSDGRGHLGTSRGAAVSSEHGRSDPAHTEHEGDALKIAGFYVGGAVYGIDLMRIKEVVQALPFPIRDVPHAPAIVEGVIQLRGVVIPVIDLRKRFGAPIDEKLTRLNKLIIVSVGGRIVGLKVDRILGELRVMAGQVRPAPSMLRPHDGSGSELDFFAGVCHVGKNMVFVVNLEAVIDPGRTALPHVRRASGTHAAGEPEQGDGA